MAAATKDIAENWRAYMAQVLLLMRGGRPTNASQLKATRWSRRPAIVHDAAAVEQIVRKLRDADAMLNSVKELSAVLQALEVSESTLERWRKQYGGRPAEEAGRGEPPAEGVGGREGTRLKTLKLIAEGNSRALLGSERL